MWDVLSSFVVLIGWVFLFPYPIETKESWTDVLDRCLVSPTFNLDVIWASSSCLLLHKILTTLPWSRLLRTFRQTLHCPRWAAMSLIGYSRYTIYREISFLNFDNGMSYLSSIHYQNPVWMSIIHLALPWVVELVFLLTNQMSEHNINI